MLSWINATLSEVVLPYIVGLQTSQAVWEDLEKRYASLTRSHVIQLEQQLQNIRKGILCMQDYLQQVKILADKLATCGASVDENDLILYTLNRLSSSYHSFIIAINTKSMANPVSLEELHTLICEELNLEDT